MYVICLISILHLGSVCFVLSQVAFLCINMLDEMTAYEFGGRSKECHKGNHYQMYMASMIMQEVMEKYPTFQWNVGSCSGSAPSDRFIARTDIVAVPIRWVRLKSIEAMRSHFVPYCLYYIIFPCYITYP